MLLRNLYKFNQFGGDPVNNKTFYLIIVIIAVSFILYDYYKSRDNKKTQPNTQPNTNVIIKESPLLPSMAPSPIPVGQKLREYDYRALNDELTPPFKRDDYYVPPQLLYPREFGLYTKGTPGIFRKMGYLKNLSSTDYKFLTLMGRQKYQGSTQYEYYVTSTDKDSSIKFYLDNYKRELYDGDKVKISQLNNEEYDVIIDKNLDFEYIPYV
jgi:hypothetical protein